LFTYIKVYKVSNKSHSILHSTFKKKNEIDNMTRRVPSSIPGLDEMIEGGFIENDVILLTGPPGAGKSTFGIQYLYKGVTEYNEPGVYVTLEESPARIMRNMWRHGWDLERAVKENKLRIIRSNPILYSKYIKEKQKTLSTTAEVATIEHLLKEIYSNIKEIGAKRLFIDSLTSLKISSDPVSVRHVILEFIRNVENMDCTTLITSEIQQHNANFNVEEYLCEGVIKMHVFRVSGNRNRAIEILKMRGVKHKETIHPYNIVDDGIVVYPSESVIGDECDTTDFISF